ncbi:MAG: TRIC cation channel family protein [Burkholderiales bacterium]
MLAIDKTLGLAHSAPVAVVMGIVTGIGGGLIRDVLIGKPTPLTRKELYATPILLGGLLYVGLLLAVPERHELAACLGCRALPHARSGDPLRAHLPRVADGASENVKCLPAAMVHGR